jgi:hypothetical protein
MLDPQMRQRAPDLRRLAAIHLAASFGRVKVMTAAIGIQAQRQAIPAEHFQQRLERRTRAFFRDQKRRVDLACGVVHRHHQGSSGGPSASHACRETSPDLVRGRLWCNHAGNGRRGRLRRCAPRRSAFRLRRNAFVQL